MPANVASTDRGRRTRARILTGAAEVLRERGVAGVILDDVMARTGTSKSQLFHYFPGGKDELLLAVLHQHAEVLLTEQHALLTDLAALRTEAAWQAWRDAVVGYFHVNGTGCALQTLAQHVGRTDPAAHTVVASLFDRWRSAIAGAMRAAAPGLDAQRASAALVAGIQGGATLMLSTGTSTYLEAALDSGIDQMRNQVSR
ncbi:TetR/AcrR family transcriptional regulator [Actinoplanes sp. NPDC051494]|uniref:TetR/AcrR family transcriptional regulator n=1 Tax=Actinoplanes sp. NPDC051494 TaxID=3363907 RepID=UPI0037A6365B